jgi:hypothetical protein
MVPRRWGGRVRGCTSWFGISLLTSAPKARITRAPRGTGTVTDAGGQPYNLLWINRNTVAVEFATDQEDFVFDQHMFKIQLTPIGG